MSMATLLIAKEIAPDKPSFFHWKDAEFLLVICSMVFASFCTDEPLKTRSRRIWNNYCHSLAKTESVVISGLVKMEIFKSSEGRSENISDRVFTEWARRGNQRCGRAIFRLRGYWQRYFSARSVIWLAFAFALHLHLLVFRASENFHYNIITANNAFS